MNGNSIAVPEPADVRQLHDLLLERSDADPGVRRERHATDLLADVLSTAASAPTAYDAAAVVLTRLPEIHVFEDGNKRTALLTAGYVLELNDAPLAPGDEELYPVMNHIRRFETEEIAHWLRTGEIDESRLRYRR
jgi:death-on-curing family protein